MTAEPREVPGPRLHSIVCVQTHGITRTGIVVDIDDVWRMFTLFAYGRYFTYRWSDILL